jgi:hypothetical protein
LAARHRRRQAEQADPEVPFEDHQAKPGRRRGRRPSRSKP